MEKKSAVTDEELIAALLTYGTIRKAAEAAGISARTLTRRMENPEFKADYLAARMDIVRNAVNHLNGRMNEAIDTIAAIMNDGETNPAVRLQAAQSILNAAVKMAARLQNDEIYYENARMNFCVKA